jgi:hypothetical protein
MKGFGDMKGFDGGSGGGHGWWGGSAPVVLEATRQTFTGTSGFDRVTMASGGGTVLVSGIEELTGKAGTDVVTLGSAGNTLQLSGIETLTGGAGSDAVCLTGFGSTLAVSGIETLAGGPGSDVVTVTGGGIRFLAGASGDQLALATGAGAGTDQVVFDQDSRMGSYGRFSNDTPTQITHFQSGTDTLVLGGPLAWSLDRNGNDTVQGATRATGTIDVSTDEAAVLSTVATSLNDTKLAAVRTAIGTLTNTSRRASLLVLANDGTDSGAYLVRDSNGDGQVGASEIRLLGIFKGTTSIGLGDIVYG